jgi:hypothetical protein
MGVLGTRDGAEGPIDETDEEIENALRDSNS